MALPSPKFYTTGDVEITTHDFGSVEAGAYKPDATGWKFRLWNDFGGGLSSDDMTSVKISVRDADGGTDELWTQQHWVQIKSSSGSTGVVDDDMTVFQAVGKNKDLSLGDIPSGEYRTLYARCYPPTDATEQDVDFQLRVTYQQPQTSICNWITGLRGNGVVATTGDPFAMSTGGSTGTIPYEAGYALINNNEIYYGSSGSYDISTTSSGTYKIYLSESGSFNETTGSVAPNELQLYEATISSGICTALTDKRVYLAGLQAGSTGAMPSTPDKGDLYLDLTNALLYVAKSAGSWDLISANTFLGLTDTPSDYSGDASKILTVNTGENAVEFTPLPEFFTHLEDQLFFGELVGDATNQNTTGIGVLYQKLGAEVQFKGIHSTGNITVTDSTGTITINLDVNSTGIKLDDLGTPDNNTDLNATTGYHGLLPILSGSSGEYLNGDGSFVIPQSSDVEISEIGAATYDDVQDWINNTQSGGRISGGVIADDTSGGITISSGTGFTKTTTGDIGLTKSFDWSAGTLVSAGLTDNSINYIYMDYNAGSPQILATNDRTAIRLQDQFTLGRIYKSSGDLHIINSGVNLYNASRRMHEVKIEVAGFQRASGGVISESATTERTLQVTAGIFFLGDTEMVTSAQNTSTGGSDYFTYHYYINSAWTSATGQTAINNTQYNDISSTGLETLTANRYGVHWGYIHFDSDIHIIYGQGNYSLAQAEEAVIPNNLPCVVEDFGTLAAKIIIQKSSTGFKSIVTAYKTLFPVSSPSEHNDLGGLDTADYQHLTQAEHDVNVYSNGTFTVGRLTEILSSGGVIKESPFTVTTGDVFDFGAHSAVFTEQAIATTTGTAAINWNNGLKALYTRSTGAGGAVTFSFTAPVKSANLMLTIRGSTVGSTGTVTWPVIKWDGGSEPSLGSGASAINVASFYYSTGLTSYLGQCSTGTFSS